ncbi:MAG: hypothetical protein PWQ55_333 [Chloroflexota bacterium]|nr:hypothetical protein [Chloroflexota bacterium]
MSKFKVKFATLILGGILIAIAACTPKNSTADSPQMAPTIAEAQLAETVPEAESQPEPVEMEAIEESPTLPPAETVAAAPSLMPVDPPASERTLEDSDSSLRANEHRTLSGDNILNNLYERPFTAREMIYQPDLDIETVDIAVLDEFFYFTITLKGIDRESSAMYGIEFDRTKTGRGDLLVLCHNPADEWSLDNMIVLEDINKDVGGVHPIIADENFNGSGYDQQVELADNRLAFARVSPDDPRAIQFAISLALLDYPEEFLWGAWVDNGLQDFSMFDYNDAIGPGQAGSPMKDSDDYPIKELFSLDNTCRLPFGFEQETSTVPGTCINIGPASASGSGCIRYCVRLCMTHAGCCEWGCR